MIHFDFLQKLQKAQPKKRIKMLNALHAKNVKFLAGRHEALAAEVQRIGTGAYEIQINADFLNIFERQTGRLCHPENDFLGYTNKLGAWHHTGWLDKLKVTHLVHTGVEHGQRVFDFIQAVHKQFPEIGQAMATSTEISLPKLADSRRRFSGVTVFLGSFLGAHINQYLNRTQARGIVIVEPDLSKFSLSCYFVDYGAIERHMGKLVLHVGPNMPENPLQLLIGDAYVSATAWLRFLPAYPSDDFNGLIDRFELRWRALSEIFVPYDRELRNLVYGSQNMDAGLPINSRLPELSDNSRIAVIASGPSLDKEIDWLKANQDKLIIFSAHSAVNTLKSNGIEPDYQCSLDTELGDELIEKLGLDFEIPFISYYKASPESLSKFEKVLLVNEAAKANAVVFNMLLNFTHPTTGNTAVASAMLARPKQLYLIGLDFGFRDAGRDHAAGYWEHQNKDHKDIAPETDEHSISVEANFEDSEGEIYTRAYYNTARKGVEAALSTIRNDAILCYNLADGAKINGAEAKHSSDIDLSDYPEKADDKAEYEASFSAEKSWSVFEHDGDEVLDTMRNAVKTHLKLKTFSWMRFTKAIDSTWTQIVQDCVALQAGDIRIEVYSKLIQDFLVEWYRMMIFCKTLKQAEKVYKQGYQELNKALDELEWPQSLHDFDHKYRNIEEESNSKNNENI